MTYNQFIFKSLLFNYRKYLGYFFCITFSMTVFFLFSAIWLVPDFSEQASRGTRQIVQIGGVISVLFSLFLITYSYQHFFKSRTKEIGILLSYGLLHRDLKRMITLENTVIFLVALLAAFISGGIFSRLFFILATAILGLDDIHFSLTYKSFVYTAVMFLPLYFLIVVMTIVKIKKISLSSLLKEGQVSEMKKQGSVIAAILGLVLMVSSFVYLYNYTSNFTHVASMKKVILVSLLVCILGIYLFLSHLQSLLYRYWNSRKTVYQRNILTLSEFSSRFAQNRSIIFMISLLSMGIVFFATISYTLYQQSSAIADKEQWFDVIVKDNQAVELTKQVDIDKIIQESEVKPTEQHNLHVVYTEAPEMKHTAWRTNKTVMISSVSEYNQVFSARLIVAPKSAIVVDFNQSSKGELHYFNKTVDLKNGDSTYKFIHQKTVQKKLFDRYVFAQPVMVILNDEDFRVLSTNAQPETVGSIEMFQFKDWHDSGEFVTSMKDEMKAAQTKLTDRQKLALKSVMGQQVMPIIVHSKYDRYVHVKQVGGFALFIMSFISVLFFLTVCVVLYFKIFTDQENDIRKVQLLHTIGITSGEVKGYLYRKIKQVMVLPILLGSLTGLVLSVVINMQNVTEMEMANSTIFANGLKICGLLLIFFTLYYQWLKLKYRRAIIV
ncbi:ABC transporter permease [Bacillus sp. DNRA2]|uniref:FtsX-like permease family protein n=1 Tax=Bacillus sp. DNRA2 TaxID=2723053 RepID=UPI00145CEFA0|nr:ABC transporter permease [Bacillus sp. DNRA2]NMD71010.1 ABC transporter permease [Bacillus sp. DNRA2]